MAFTATPQDGSSPTPIPMSSAVPDGTNTPLAIEGGPSVTTGGNTLVPVSMYVKDGNDIAQGTSTDAANANSVIGQLKQIKTNTTLGSATSANSLPMVMASDQPPIGVIESCIVSTVNSSTATLTANSVFTGTSESALPFSALSVEVFSDQASAAGGLSVQQSQNGTNWDTVDTFSVVASTAFNTTVNLIGQFLRVVYTNGATNQAAFRLQTIKQPVDVVLPRTLTAAGNLKVDGSAVTQPVSGTVTANAGTNLNTSLLALETGGNLATLAGTVTSTRVQANVSQINGVTPLMGNGASGTGAQRVTIASDSTGQVTLATGASTIGAVTQASGPWTNNITQVGGSAVTLGSKTSANSYPVVIASDQASMPMTIQATSGTALVADQTNSVLRVSNYVKTTTAGDTALTLGSATSANSLPVVVASDQAAFTTNQGASAAAGTAWRVKGDFTEQAALSAGALNASLVASTDVSAYKWFSLQITGTWSGTLTFQGSNDGINWLPNFAVTNASLGGITISTAVNGIYSGPCLFRYLRVPMTAYTSGTATGTLELYTSAPAVVNVLSASAQSGPWTVQPGNTQNTTPWLVTNSNNNASVPTGAANTVVKASAGQLATLVVTTAGTGAGNVQIFDNASTNTGTVLFAFPATVSVAQFYQIYGWAKVGMTAQNVLNGPVFTVYYS